LSYLIALTPHLQQQNQPFKQQVNAKFDRLII
jgi:hypothetical protein